MAEDLQAHYRTELARMLGPDGDRYVNPKTTAWMLRHTAATEGGTIHAGQRPADMDLVRPAPAPQEHHPILQQAVPER